MTYRTTIAVVFLSLCARAQDGYSINPSRGVRGNTYGVLIRNTDSQCDKDKGPLKGATLSVPKGSGITAKPPDPEQSDGCALSVELNIADDATAANVDLTAVKDKKVVYRTQFTVADSAPGPVPPGIEPSVDVTWKVLSRKTLADNFGRRVANLYYGIEVVLGNDSGYDLSIASINFSLSRPTHMPVPNDSYRIVRGSLEHEQQVGVRNTAVNVIKGIGPVLTGASVFFNTQLHLKMGVLIYNNNKLFYTEIVGIFTSPFEKAIELIFPDLTIPQLNALDNETLRDGMIIHNNEPVRTIVFISQATLARFTSVPIFKTNDVTSAPFKLKSGLKKEFDPLDVADALGDLVLEGKIIDYRRRIHIVTKSNQTPAAPLQPLTFKQGQAATSVTLPVKFVAGMTVTSADPAMTIGTPAASADGNSTIIQVTVGEGAQAGTGKFTIGGGASPSSINYVIQAQSPSNVTTTSSTKGKKGDSVKLDFTGHFLQNIDLVVAFDPKTTGLEATWAAASPDGTKRTLTVKVTSAKPGDYKLTGKDQTGAAVSLATFTVN
jgi:hypothetical protein